jgi:hypothetical protein
MNRTQIGLAVGMLLCCSVPADAQFFPAHAPNNALPQVQYFHQASDESLQLDDVHDVTETIAIREVDPATGKERLIPASETRQVIERRTYRLADLRAKSVKGEELKLSDVLAKLKPEDPVIVISKGSKLPAGYHKLLRDDVVVLEIPGADRRPVVAAPGFAPPSGERPIFIPADSTPRLPVPPGLPFGAPPTTRPVPAPPNSSSPERF